MEMNVFVSRPTVLDEHHLMGFYRKLRDRKYAAQTLGLDEVRTLRSPLEAVCERIQRCQGAIIIGYPKVPPGRESPSTTEWNHIEAGIAYSLHLPILVIRDTAVSGGFFDAGAANSYVHSADLSTTVWQDDPAMTGAFNELDQLMKRRPNDPNGGRHIGEREARLVRILEPAEGVRVPIRWRVEGSAPNDTDIWVVVHPVGHPKYYVQGCTRANSGAWELDCTFGEPPDTGKAFEIRAVVEAEPLTAGGELNHWPIARYPSFTRSVRRQ